MKFIKIVFFVLSTLLIVSCGQHDICVMKVGSKQLKLSEAMQIVDQSTVLSRDENLTAKRVEEYIEGLFAKDMLYMQEAENMGLSKVDSVQEKIQEYKKKTLTRVKGPLYEDVVKNIPEPTADQLHDIYEKRQHTYKLAHILLPSKELADSVFQKLKMKQNFVKLAKQYSFDRTWADENGEWKNWFLYGTMGGDFDDLIVNALPRVALPPIKTQYGYQIVAVIRTMPRTSKPFNKEVDWLKNVYWGMERKRVFFHYQNLLPEKYNFKVNENVAQLIRSVYFKQPDGLPALKLSDLRADQLKQVLATFKGGELTVGNFVQYYSQQRANSLPPLDRIDAIKEYAKTAAMTDLMYLDALEREVDRDPKYQLALEQFEKNLYRMIVSQSMYQSFTVTKEEVRNRYDADTLFQNLSFKDAELWVEKTMRTEKMTLENERQIKVLKEKYPIAFCDKGIKKLMEAFKRSE